jgi:anthranilate synthase component 1
MPGSGQALKISPRGRMVEQFGALGRGEPSLLSTTAAFEASLLLPSSPRPTIFRVQKDFIADLETPLSTLLKVRAHAAGGARGDYCFLLESVEGGKHLARYSFVGAGPRDVLAVGGVGGAAVGDPLAPLQAALARSVLLRVPGTQAPPFSGGAVGYVGYDCVRFFEPRVAAAVEAQPDVLGIPEALFMFVDTLVVFDHVRHTVSIVAHGALPPHEEGASAEARAVAVAAAYRGACDAINTLRDRLAGPLPTSTMPLKGTAKNFTPPRALKSSPPRIESLMRKGGDAVVGGGGGSDGGSGGDAPSFSWEACSNLGRQGYEDAVRALQRNIFEGDIIQAVPSQRVSRAIPPGSGVCALDMYRQLRILNPSPYMFYLECGAEFAVRFFIFFRARARTRVCVYVCANNVRASDLPFLTNNPPAPPSLDCGCVAGDAR